MTNLESEMRRCIEEQCRTHVVDVIVAQVMRDARRRFTLGEEIEFTWDFSVEYEIQMKAKPTKKLSHTSWGKGWFW